MKTSASSQKAITSSRTAVSQETEGLRPGLPPTLSESKTVSWKSTGMGCKTKPHRQSPSAAFPYLATASLHSVRHPRNIHPHTDWRHHESHWKHHLHYRRRIGHWPRARRGATQTRKQSDHLWQTQEPSGLRGEGQSGHRGD